MLDQNRFLQYWENMWSPNPVKLIGVPICPDLLTINDLGVADTWRGRLIRAFFRLLPAPKTR